jgi:predicted MFS family arabinose efflux permease
MGIGYSMLALVTLETAPPGEEGAASAAMQIAEAIGVAAGTGVAGAVISAMAVGPGLGPGLGAADLLLALVAAAGIFVARRIPDADPIAHSQPRPLDTRIGKY